MWKLNRIGQEKVWYEKELIEKIKEVCKPALQHSQSADVWALGQKHLAKQILEMIQEWER